MKNLSHYALQGYVLFRGKAFYKERKNKEVLCTYLTIYRFTAEIYRSTMLFYM